LVFEKRKVDILKKQGRLALRPLRQERQGRVLPESHSSESFVVGQFEFHHECKEELAKGASLIWFAPSMVI
jgi:hypothetical protein